MFAIITSMNNSTLATKLTCETCIRARNVYLQENMPKTMFKPNYNSILVNRMIYFKYITIQPSQLPKSFTTAKWSLGIDWDRYLMGLRWISSTRREATSTWFLGSNSTRCMRDSEAIQVGPIPRQHYLSSKLFMIRTPLGNKSEGGKEISQVVISFERLRLLLTYTDKQNDIRDKIWTICNFQINMMTIIIQNFFRWKTL